MTRDDRNGRISRLLTTLLPYRQGYVVGRYISIENKIEKTKAKYYEVLGESGITRKSVSRRFCDDLLTENLQGIIYEEGG